MRWLYATFICTLFVCTAASAQDIIQRTDGVKIEGKVIEVKGSEIHFTKTAENTGKIYIISKEDVASVTYQNGSVQQFTSTAAPPIPGSLPTSYNKGRNILGIRPIDLAFTNFSFFYEHLSANRKFGIRLPISIGLGHGWRKEYVSNSFSILRNRTFSTGLDLNFYVGEPDKFRYYVGPSFQLGFFRYSSWYYTPDIYPTAIQQTRTGSHYAILLNNGLWYQISNSVLLGMDLGLGFQRRVIRTDYNYDPPNTLKVSGNISVGFQF